MTRLARFDDWCLEHPLLFLGGWWAGILAFGAVSGLLLSWLFAACFVVGATPGSLYLTVATLGRGRS